MSDSASESSTETQTEFGNELTVPGKKLLPMLAVGCLLFTVIMGFGMFFVAKWSTPFFKKSHIYVPPEHT